MVTKDIKGFGLAYVLDLDYPITNGPGLSRALDKREVLAVQTNILGGHALRSLGKLIEQR